MSDTRPAFIVSDGLAYVLCHGCGGQGWEPNKPWKGEGYWWFRCATCGNPADFPEPEYLPTQEDWDWQNGTVPRSQIRQAPASPDNPETRR